MNTVDKAKQLLEQTKKTDHFDARYLFDFRDNVNPTTIQEICEAYLELNARDAEWVDRYQASQTESDIYKADATVAWSKLEDAKARIQELEEEGRLQEIHSLELETEVASLSKLNSDGCDLLAKQIEANAELVDAAEFAQMTIDHALHLGYCGEGSTKGMCEDASSKLEKALAKAGAK